MYTITIKNEIGEVVDVIDLQDETMTTVARELEEQVNNLIDGYSIVIEYHEKGN